jgi:hypothetical protein
MIEDLSELSVSGLEQIVKENVEWWNNWIASFLAATSKHFSKPYTVQHIHKISKHVLQGTEPTLFPANAVFVPHTVQIRGGSFWVHWTYYTIPATIDIPDLPEEIDVSKPLPVPEVQEVTMDDVPNDPNATESLTLDPPTKFYDKHKVKEARLKAKIAMYRAQHQLNKYYEKYGTEISDSDTDESDEEDEEIQL